MNKPKKLLPKAERAKRIAEGKARAAARRAELARGATVGDMAAFDAAAQLEKARAAGRRKADQGVELPIFTEAGEQIGVMKLLPGYRIAKEVV